MFPVSSISITLAGNNSHWISVFVLLACLSVQGQITQKSQKWLGAPSSNCEENLNVERSDFPSDFVFGASTAAAQIEGSSKSGGKGPSVWDEYVRKFPEKIMNRSNLEVAIDSYNRYKEDGLVLRDLGVDAYRFSIPWTRILPDGTLSGGINQEGVNHYNNLIDELIKHGIKPFVTLMHFDSPEALENKYGGFLNRTVVKDFKNYAEICFKAFGDRVKNWITINEPLIIAKFGYAMGVAPPGRCSDRRNCPAGDSATEPYVAAHNLLLAHATAAKLYKEKYQATQGGQIGMSLVGQYYEPYSNTLFDRIAAKRAMDFELGWFMEPLVRGQYPLSMRRLVKGRLPVFTEKEKKLVNGSFDFIGINYYTSRYVKNIPINPKAAPVSFLADEHINSTVVKNGVPIGPKAEGSWFLYIYPKGLYKILKFMKKHYNKNLIIYITENGVTEKKNDSIPIHQVLNDQFRIEFVQKHLQQISKAVNNGVNVKGYFYWSLFDDFEWTEGFGVGFGLYYIDYNNNLKRIPKKSAKWYHDFVKGDRKQAC
ncbi:beta-glucosidase 13-like [Durio zibethinus]|uniref:Beta-glucosidase 13-like n=1 Tax=Durio zibethinus TaxID=66656 RepID=A0A6P5YCG5_DURZI|nr:beta-glucosidase 13-like [Durio zibethinus]